MKTWTKRKLRRHRKRYNKIRRSPSSGPPRCIKRGDIVRINCVRDNLNDPPLVTELLHGYFGKYVATYGGGPYTRYGITLARRHPALSDVMVLIKPKWLVRGTQTELDNWILEMELTR